VSFHLRRYRLWVRLYRSWTSIDRDCWRLWTRRSVRLQHAASWCIVIRLWRWLECLWMVRCLLAWFRSIVDGRCFCLSNLYQMESRSNHSGSCLQFQASPLSVALLSTRLILVGWPQLLVDSKASAGRSVLEASWFHSSGKSHSPSLHLEYSWSKFAARQWSLANQPLCLPNPF